MRQGDYLWKWEIADDSPDMQQQQQFEISSMFT